MSVLRLAGGGLLALIACYAGVLIRRKYRDRVTFYRSALDFSRFLKSELGVKKSPIPDIVGAFTRGRKGDFEELIARCIESMRQGKDVGLQSAPKLKEQERQTLLSLISGLGKSSLEDQLALADRLEAHASLKVKECEEESKRLGGMYFKLCVLLGLAIILVLA